MRKLTLWSTIYTYQLLCLMGSAMKLKWVLLAGFLASTAAALNAGTPAGSSDIAGSYRLVSVNAHELPAEAWLFANEESSCGITVKSGTLILGPLGQWAAIVHQDYHCVGKQWALGQGARREFFYGTYLREDEHIRLLLSEGVQDADWGEFAADEKLHIKVRGAFDFKGQTELFSFKKIAD